MGIGTEELEALETPGSDEIYPPYPGLVTKNVNQKTHTLKHDAGELMQCNNPRAPSLLLAKPGTSVPAVYENPQKLLQQQPPRQQQLQQLNQHLQSPQQQQQQPQQLRQQHHQVNTKEDRRLTFNNPSKNLLVSALKQEESEDSWDQVPLQRFRANSIDYRKF